MHKRYFVRFNNNYLRHHRVLRYSACPSVRDACPSLDGGACLPYTSDQDNEIVIRKSLRTIILWGSFPSWARNLFDTWSCNKISRKHSLYLQHVEIMAADFAIAQKMWVVSPNRCTWSQIYHQTSRSLKIFNCKILVIFSISDYSKEMSYFFPRGTN